ncbi:MAG TPA: efflux RND transporter periplasmic adaptor subunit [Burkholderiaceae bacterium]|nr:efflux RND transporter periplasmic adaptor subunit [Burkholderiaceae bacterium]
MVSKKIYSVVAVLGIAAASGAAWWYQNKTTSAATDTTSVTSPSGSNGAASATAAPSGSGTGGASGNAAPRAPNVESAKVEVMKLTDDTQSVGSLKSRQSVVVRPEVSGRVTELNFKDGDRVRKGQVLVQFDDQLPLAQLKQSQAELSIVQANHKRNQDLVAENFISKRSLDESAANVEVAMAKLALAQATVARLKIKAPFDGMTGIRNVNVGDYLKDGGDIVNIEDMTAVFVDYRLPERFQSKIKKGQKAQVDLDALPGRKFAAEIQAIDPLVDANGRSVSVRACIDNRQQQLRPGMFAKVNTVFGERDNAKVIPEEAIVPQGGKQFVIKLIDGTEKDSKITQRVEVKVGIRRPGKVEILEGLSEGDEVVTAGQQRVQKDGTTVKVVELGKTAAGGKPIGASQTGGGPGQPPATAGNAANTASAVPAAGSAKPSDKVVNGTMSKAKIPPGPNPCLDGNPAKGGKGKPDAAR